jgi:integrase/recombinase XerD
LSFDFLNHLETTRANRPSSRNVRLAAIKSFMHFLEFREPAAIDQIRRILAIPPKKAETRLVRHLTVEETNAILNAPDPAGWDGIRDRAMLHLCFAAGLRVSELVGLQLRDVTLQPQASILVHGKGRRERCLPLWKVTTAALRAWLSVRGSAPTPDVFVSARGQALTRSGFEYILAKARRNRSELLSRADDEARLAPRPATHLRPHCVGGHQGSPQGLSLARNAHMQTTAMYTRADPSVKPEALESMIAPRLRSGRFKATDKLIASLTSRSVMRTTTR